MYLAKTPVQIHHSTRCRASSTICTSYSYLVPCTMYKVIYSLYCTPIYIQGVIFCDNHRRVQRRGLMVVRTRNHALSPVTTHPPTHPPTKLSIIGRRQGRRRQRGQRGQRSEEGRAEHLILIPCNLISYTYVFRMLVQLRSHCFPFKRLFFPAHPLGLAGIGFALGWSYCVRKREFTMLFPSWLRA